MGMTTTLQYVQKLVAAAKKLEKISAAEEKSKSPFEAAEDQLPAEPEAPPKEETPPAEEAPPKEETPPPEEPPPEVADQTLEDKPKQDNLQYRQSLGWKDAKGTFSKQKYGFFCASCSHFQAESGQNGTCHKGSVPEKIFPTKTFAICNSWLSAGKVKDMGTADGVVQKPGTKAQKEEEPPKSEEQPQ